MAINAYLIVDGRPGPSTSRSNAIDILSFRFGTSQPARTVRAGRANLDDVTITKVVDAVSPLLFDDCVTGNYLPSVQVLLDKLTGDDHQDFYKLVLVGCVITAIGHSGTRENLKESVSFSYARIKVCYNPEAGGALSNFIEKGFDVLTLKSW